MTVDATPRDPDRPDAPAQRPDGDSAVRDLLDAIFDTSDDAAVIVDDAGDIRYVTDGTSLLLGHDRAAAIGRSVFDFLHPDDVEAVAELFVRRLGFEGADQGKEIRVRHARGDLVTVLANATVLPPGADPTGLGTCVIRLRPLREGDREVGLQRRIVVNEYVNALAADLMAAPDPDAVHVRVADALEEIALLTGADTVAVCVERPSRSGLDVTANRQREGDAPLRVGPDADVRELLLTESLSLDAVGRHRPELAAAFGPRPAALLSAPFSTADRRGVLVLLRSRPGPAWWATDAELAHHAAAIIGRALHTAWSERLLTLTYRHGPVAFSIHDWNGELLDCNDRYLELFAVDRAHTPRLARLSSLDDPARAALIRELGRLHAGETDRMDLEFPVRRGDGATIWVRSNGVRLGLPGSEHSVLLSSYADVTDRREQQLELEFAANHDPLTGVANRTALWRRLGEMQTAHGRLPTLMIVDLDRFKQVNDTYGHHVGDQVLEAVVRRFRANTRAEDVVARLGGDEFAIALPGVPLADAEATAERLRVAIAQPIEVEGRTISQTMSVGVAAGDECSAVAELMVHADRALYAAKHRGRDCQVVFHTAMDDAALADVQLERELRAAIDTGQLEVHFQPEVSIADRAVVGAEALVRWRHPERGLVPAGAFITVAERSGLIDEIGRFALKAATRAFADACRETDRQDLTLRVNISAREFARPELCDLVRSAVERSGLDPSRLCLEMTETTLMEAPEIALATFSTLREVGVQFAIDDFGTGYSSLAYLKRFPVDVLEIDRTFVHDIDHDEDSRAIVSSIVNLADALSLDVVAEGVEHEGQLDVLAQLGCERAQGYLIAAPMPVGEFVEHLLADTRTGRPAPLAAAHVG